MQINRNSFNKQNSFNQNDQTIQNNVMNQQEQFELMMKKQNEEGIVPNKEEKQIPMFIPIIMIISIILVIIIFAVLIYNNR